jgi:hypothetical protein
MSAASSAKIAAMPGSRLLFARASVTLDHKGSTAKAAVAAFGLPRIRIAMTHAKLITIRNDRWNITIRGSANMCRNLRVENFDISDDPAVADQTDAFVEHFFATMPEGLHVAQTIISRAMRQALGDTAEGPAEPARGPIKLVGRRHAFGAHGRSPGAGVVPEVEIFPSPLLIVLLPSRVDLLLTSPAVPLALPATAATTAAPECPRHLSTSSPQPITLPRARGAALQLPLLSLGAPMRPGAAGSSPPRG